MTVPPYSPQGQVASYCLGQDKPAAGRKAVFVFLWSQSLLWIKVIHCLKCKVSGKGKGVHMFTATVLLLYRLGVLGLVPLPWVYYLKTDLRFVRELYLSVCWVLEAIVGMQKDQSVQMSLHDTAQDAACIIMNKARGRKNAVSLNIKEESRKQNNQWICCLLRQPYLICQAPSNSNHIVRVEEVALI